MPALPGGHLQLLVADVLRRRRGVIMQVNSVSRMQVNSSLVIVGRTRDAAGLQLQRRWRRPPMWFHKSLKLLQIVEGQLGL